MGLSATGGIPAMSLTVFGTLCLRGTRAVWLNHKLGNSTYEVVARGAEGVGGRGVAEWF